MTANEERRPAGNRTALDNPNSKFNNNHRQAEEQSQPSSLRGGLEIVLSYIRRGWATVPVPLREKAPRIRGWTKLRITEAEAPSYFAGPGNIGVILGEASGGLVDIDLDCSEAINFRTQVSSTNRSDFRAAQQTAVTLAV